MVRVEIKKLREQTSHFGLYRTSAGGDQEVFVRRKVGEPTDYMHTKSRKLTRQRENMAIASHHYASLTPSQKAITRGQIEEVEYQKSHGKTETKVMLGRQLFIAKEIRSLNVTQKQLSVPLEICIMLTDQDLNPLEGELWLYCTVTGEWFHLPKDELYTGNWLFTKVPPGYPPYRVYGEALGHFDPEIPETQAMTLDELRAYRYHKLISAVPEYTTSWRYVDKYVAQGFRANKYAGTVDILSWVTAPLFVGDLTIGIKEYIGPFPPPEWIANKTYHISYGMPDPKHYHTILPGLNLIHGTIYWLEWRLSVSPPTLMSGQASWWLIP